MSEQCVMTYCLAEKQHTPRPLIFTKPLLFFWSSELFSNAVWRFIARRVRRTDREMYNLLFSPENGNQMTGKKKSNQRNCRPEFRIVYQYTTNVIGDHFLRKKNIYDNVTNLFM